LLFLSWKKTQHSVILLILSLSLLALGGIAIPAAKAALNVTLTPNSGPPGTVVQVSCSGFTPNGQVEASINGTDLGTTAADANGNINFNVTVPDFPNGLYKFTATDLTTSSTTQVDFTVTQSSTSPTPSPAPTTPEFPSMLIVLTALTAVSLATLLYTKKAKPDSKNAA